MKKLGIPLLVIELIAFGVFTSGRMGAADLRQTLTMLGVVYAFFNFIGAGIYFREAEIKVLLTKVARITFTPLFVAGIITAVIHKYLYHDGNAPLIFTLLFVAYTLLATRNAVDVAEEK